MLFQVAFLNLRCPAFWPMPHVGGASGRLRLRPAPRQSLPLRSWIWWRTWRGLSFACFAVAAHNRTNCAWPSAIRVRSATPVLLLCVSLESGNEKRRPLSSHLRRLTYHLSVYVALLWITRSLVFQNFFFLYEPAARGFLARFALLNGLSRQPSTVQ